MEYSGEEWSGMCWRVEQIREGESSVRKDKERQDTI